MDDRTLFRHVPWRRKAVIATNNRGNERTPLRTVFALSGAACLAVSAAACGTASKPQVAQLGSIASQTTASSSQSAAGGATSPQSSSTQTLAFSRCMRSHGVANFPDPDNSGLLPKREVGQLAANPLFVPAHRACEHLLPNGGQPTQTQVQQAWTDMRNFTHCMRSHGVPSWPAPTVTSAQDNRPFFNLPNTVDPSSPKVATATRECEHVMHAGNPLVTTQ